MQKILIEAVDFQLIFNWRISPALAHRFVGATNDVDLASVDRQGCRAVRNWRKCGNANLNFFGSNANYLGFHCPESEIFCIRLPTVYWFKGKLLKTGRIQNSLPLKPAPKYFAFDPGVRPSWRTTPASPATAQRNVDTFFCRTETQSIAQRGKSKIFKIFSS
jgi:hypothetical protein